MILKLGVKGGGLKRIVLKLHINFNPYFAMHRLVWLQIVHLWKSIRSLASTPCPNSPKRIFEFFIRFYLIKKMNTY